MGSDAPMTWNRLIRRQRISPSRIARGLSTETGEGTEQRLDTAYEAQRFHRELMERSTNELTGTIAKGTAFLEPGRNVRDLSTGL